MSSDPSAQVHSSANGSLFFSRVALSEAGSYTCEARNTLGEDVAMVTINVYGK